MLQAKLAIIGTGLAGLAHTAYVLSERQKAPKGRLQEFSPAGQDQLISDRLKTGDLILFRRNCTLYTCAGALVCSARQLSLKSDHAHGEQFAPDQAGVIVVIKNVPHVLERTFSGTKLRRYDHRITATRSPEVLIRPLRSKLPLEDDRRLQHWAMALSSTTETTTNDVSSEDVGALTELLARLPFDRSYNASLDLVSKAYNVAGLLPQQRLTMRDVIPQHNSSRAPSLSARRSLAVAGGPARSHESLQPPPSSTTAGVDHLFSREVWVRDLR